MWPLLNSRRFVAASLAIISLVIIALVNTVDTSMAIATVAVAVAGADAMEKRGGSRNP